jgi:S1-C subfamily serine protease
LATNPNKSAHGKHGAKPAARGVFISSAQVLALAERRAMPRAVPVQATADHPAGLRLRGVSALGVGMQDGDVLTEAAGQHAVSVASVVGAVLAARAAHSAQISGRFYRGGVPYTVIVEQPYPPGT